MTLAPLSRMTLLAGAVALGGLACGEARVVTLVLSTIGHGYLPGLFRFLLWLWPIAMVAVLVGMTFNAYRRLKRGDLARYAVTAASVPALIVYLAVANTGAIVAAALGRKSEFNRTPKAGT